MRRTRAGIPVLLACAVIAMTLQPVASLAATCEKWAGKVVSAQGVVEVKPAGETQWRPVKLNETYCPGDTIRTDRKSRADIALYNHPILRLDQNSTVALGGMKDERTSLVDLVNGAALFFSRVTRNLEVRTATVNAGVEGTEFFIRAEEGKTEMSVFEGKVLASNAAGGLPVTTGQSAVAEAGKAPVYRVVVRPRDAVQWALYYPPVLDSRPADVPGDSNDPRVYTSRASRSLAVGRVDEAAADIAKALALDPNNSDAFALQSIVAVTQNEKGKALDLARKAVEAGPESATARIALSHAQQAGFDLPGALKSVEEAVKLGPQNALAWARLAEMRQSFGKLDEALDAAKKAEAVNPDLSRTQTVLGFSYLLRVETKKAKAAFEKAITLDDADPLPRLGLGLAKIREGNLEEGRREIEIAMSLDPDNSLIRSYLGKAYYEEKRDKLAMGQFDMAKNLDPMDPTPHFYDAIQKQTVNRPVEALREMQKAIELNDNRAVYRSRMLLDGDLAARSASLGRIYNDLGFQQIALVEGWKSVNYDPANYSAHRFLADSYAALPRHQIARVSELLQSQLLQPINITPIQPRLAQSNLLAVSAGGPSDLSFNEFNPLFERNRATLQVNGMVGENSTSGAEAVAGGLYNNFSASLGAYHFRTDGFRVNDDVKDDVYNAFVQVALSPRTSVQAEYRYRNFENGDIELRFFDDFSTNSNKENKTNFVRLGFHHAFAPGSDLLASFAYQKMDENNNSSFDIDLGNGPATLDLKFPLNQNAVGAELQHLYRANSFNVVTGGGYFQITGWQKDESSINDPIIGIIPIGSDPTSEDSKKLNLYGYTYLNFLKNVTFTVGASFDKNQNEVHDTLDKNQFNPKLGVTWNPVPDTTLRAAAFRTLKRTLITDQTLEPTQVAGFNQFYDDFDSTSTWVFGAAVDQKFNVSLYGGLEYTQRDLTIPNFTPTPEIPDADFDGKEQIGRAYLYGTPHKWVALTADYFYERFKRDKRQWFWENLDTQRVPLGINFSHPSGLNASFKATYYHQKGDFTQQGGDPTLPAIPGEDSFWLCDAAIGYRLPQRYGMITIGAKNLFDQSFHYYDTDIRNPAIQPDRVFFAKVTLSI
jgi:tetratricopeptide (TPR) repeat protein